jgi:hypothetical protein
MSSITQKKIQEKYKRFSEGSQNIGSWATFTQRS